VKKFIAMLFVLFLMLGCIGCSSNSDSGTKEDTGSFVLSFDEPKVLSKTIVPNEPIVTHKYQLKITDPDGVEEEVLISATDTYTASNYSVGVYNVKVFAKNTYGSIIGAGEADVTVDVGVTNSTSITIVQSDGLGRFNLVFIWNTANFPDAVVDIKLFDRAQKEVPIVPQVDSDQGRILVYTTLSPGFYRVNATITTLKNNQYGFTKSLRIASNLSSSATIEYDGSGVNSGNFTIVLNEDFNDEVVFSLNTDKTVFNVGEVAEINVTDIHQLTDPIVNWYVNGVHSGNGEVFELDTSTVGDYNVDCIVSIGEGEREGGTSFQYQVVQDTISEKSWSTIGTNISDKDLALNYMEFVLKDDAPYFMQMRDNGKLMLKVFNGTTWEYAVDEANELALGGRGHQFKAKAVNNEIYIFCGEYMNNGSSENRIYKYIKSSRTFELFERLDFKNFALYNSDFYIVDSEDPTTYVYTYSPHVVYSKAKSETTWTDSRIVNNGPQINTTKIVVDEHGIHTGAAPLQSPLIDVHSFHGYTYSFYSAAWHKVETVCPSGNVANFFVNEPASARYVVFYDYEATTNKLVFLDSAGLISPLMNNIDSVLNMNYDKVQYVTGADGKHYLNTQMFEYPGHRVQHRTWKYNPTNGWQLVPGSHHIITTTDSEYTKIKMCIDSDSNIFIAQGFRRVSVLAYKGR